jgi:ABC-type transport system involved in Fe-S cluster assembly fused permease/ATPase subunit
MLTYADVRYGAVAAEEEVGEEEVHAAARLAQLHDRVMGWADGYSTGVGEKGMRLSGGEKQRVGIARTLIKNPRIVVLGKNY